MRVACAVFVAFAAAVGLCGCTEPAPKAAATGAAQNASATNGLESMLRLWRDGAKEEAVRVLLAADTRSILARQSSGIFGVSEDNFVNMSRDGQIVLQEKAIATVHELKGFAEHCVEVSQVYIRRGDENSARQLLETLHKMGKNLEESTCMAILQEVGKWIAVTAQYRVDQL